MPTWVSFPSAYIEAQLKAGRTFTEIAAELDMPAGSLRRMAAERGLSRREIVAAVNSFSTTPMPASHTVHEEHPLQVPTADALLIGDLHLPYHNTLMLRRALYVARHHFPRVRDIVVGGDLFNFEALSDHKHNEPEADPNITLRLGGDVMRALFETFDRAWIVSGNHDERLARKLDRAWDLELLINAAMGRQWPSCQVSVSNLDYLYVGDTWLVGHPSNYSGQGGKTPSDYADIYGKNIITWHNHIVGMAQSKSGRFVGIDAGHMTVPEQHYYYHRRLSKYTRWQAGFVILQDSYPHVFSESTTDWKLYGC